MKYTTTLIFQIKNQNYTPAIRGKPSIKIFLNEPKLILKKLQGFLLWFYRDENSENKCVEKPPGFAQEHNQWKPNQDPKQKQSSSWEVELPDW